MKMLIEKQCPDSGVMNGVYLAVLNGKGNIQTACRKLIQLLQLDNCDLSKETFFSFFSEESAVNLESAFRQAGKSRHPILVETSAGFNPLLKITWQLAKIKAMHNRTVQYVCIGQTLNIEKPTDKSVPHLQAPPRDIGLLLQDETGLVIDINDAGAIMLNLKPDDLVKRTRVAGIWNYLKTSAGFLSPEKSPPARALQSGRKQQLVARLVTGQQEGEWLEFNAYPLFKKDQSVPYAAVTLITHSIKTEANPKPGIELLQEEFFKTTSALSWLIDEEDHLVFANPAFLKFLGMRESDLHRNALEVIPGFYTSIFESVHREVRATGIPHKKVHRFSLADGSVHHHLVNIFPVPNPQNKKLLGGEIFDVTLVYKSHEEARQVNERLLQLMQVTSEAIWEWDMLSGQVFRNKPLQELVGYDQQQMQGLAWWFQRIHPRDRDRIENDIQNALHKKLPSWHDEYRFQCADGSWKMIRDKGFIVYDQDRPVKMIGSLLDITEIKTLENQLIREKLNHQKALAKSIIAAQEKERTRLGRELHDNVNQLLAVAGLYMGMLKLSDENSEAIADKAKELITTAIQEIQAISRDMVLPRLKEMNLADSISNLVNDMRLAGNFDVHFSHNDSAGICIPEGKKTALYRILQEQLKNIIKYSQAKKVCIKLELNHSHVHLLVRDDGIGFDVMQKRKGIGLSNIFDRTFFYNGKVELNTRPGHGCELKVSMPVG